MTNPVERARELLIDSPFPIVAITRKHLSALITEVERLNHRSCAICNDSGHLEDAKAWDCGQENSECPYCPDKVNQLRARVAELESELNQLKSKINQTNNESEEDNV